MVDALVLAAGLGTRLDPLTRLVAKPAVPLGSQPLIERVLRWLAQQGLERVVINLHHRPATLTRLVGDGHHLGLSVRYSWEQPVLGSGGGPRHALPLIDTDPFLIVNADTLCGFALTPLLEAHAATGAAVTMAVVPNPAPDHYSGIRLDDDRITGFVPRGQAGSWHFVGVQVASAGVFAGLPDGTRMASVSGIYADMLREVPGSLCGWRAPERCLDVGTPADYLQAALHFEAREPGSTRAGSIAASARLTDTVVWPEAAVGPDVILNRAIVAGPVHVPDGFTADAAILVPPDVVRPGERVAVRQGVAVFPLNGTADSFVH